MQDRVTQIHPRQPQVSAGLIQIGASHSDVFLAATFRRLAVSLLRRLIHRLSTLPRGCRQVALLRGNLVLGEELLCAISVKFLLFQVRLRIQHGLLHSFQFLVPCSGHCERKTRLVHPHTSLIDPHTLLEVRILEPRQHRALRHLLALLHRQIDDASLHLEAHQAFVGLNVARQCQLILDCRLLRQSRIEVHPCRNGRRQQNQHRYRTLHRC